MDIDFTKCAVCGNDSEEGKFGNQEKPHTVIPVCPACWSSDRLQNWWKNSEREINEFAQKVAIPTSDYSMNIWKDLQMVRAYFKHEANIQDGVCPNGCALMNDTGGGDFECPACHFTMHQRTL